MASESAIDVVYRTGLTTWGTPEIKTLHSAHLHGFNFHGPYASANSQAVGIIIYGFDNSVGQRIVDTAPKSVTYNNRIFRPHGSVYPRLNASSFILEWNNGINETSLKPGFIDFFGQIYAYVTPYGRPEGGR
ncbi:MAG: hypothetical protein MN733_27745 [Nitrososphaera sp.]|nr:hypothetical protein [Nitrososphaera sp.]